MPTALFLLCFVKKLTVIGIIGNTQGVNNAVNPNKKAIINVLKSPLLGSFFSDTAIELSTVLTFSEAVVFVGVIALVDLTPKLKTKSTSVGGNHCVSSHTMNSTIPSTIVSSPKTSISCSKITVFSKYLIRILKIGSLTV